jgi:hypothetical protein
LLLSRATVRFTQRSEGNINKSIPCQLILGLRNKGVN